MSYHSKIIKKNGTEEDYSPNLPPFYTKKIGGKEEKKICLTYFITILNNEKDLDIYNLAIMCVPNGALYSVYGDTVYSAGKNPGKARFKFSNCSDFKLLQNQKRVKIIKHEIELKSSYSGMTNKKYKNKMKWWTQLYEESKQ